MVRGRAARCFGPWERQERRYLEALLAAYGIVFLAELGDKSMLMVMTMAARYSWRPVLVASAAATAFVMAVAVLFGGAAAALLPQWAVALAAAALFFGFGAWSFVEAGKEETPDASLPNSRTTRGGLALVATLAGTIVLAELGDKTQVAVLSLAGLNPGRQLLVWAGSTAGMLTVLGLATALGSRLARLVPGRLVTRAAGLVFIAFGVVALVIAVRELAQA